MKLVIFLSMDFQKKRHLDDEKDIKRSVIYNIDALGTKIGLLGNIGPELSDDQLENLGVLDILILPVGGGDYTLDATSAAKIARNTDAKVIIPVHYADDGVKYEVPQSNLELFIKEMGVEVEKTNKYKVKSAAALPEKATIVQIERTR